MSTRTEPAEGQGCPYDRSHDVPEEQLLLHVARCRMHYIQHAQAYELQQ